MRKVLLTKIILLLTLLSLAGFAYADANVDVLVGEAEKDEDAPLGFAEPQWDKDRIDPEFDYIVSFLNVSQLDEPEGSDVMSEWVYVDDEEEEVYAVVEVENLEVEEEGLSFDAVHYVEEDERHFRTGLYDVRYYIDGEPAGNENFKIAPERFEAPDFTIESVNGEDPEQVNEIDLMEDEYIEIDLGGIEERENPYSIKLGDEEWGVTPDEDEFRVSTRSFKDTDEGEYEMEVSRGGPAGGKETTQVEVVEAFKTREEQLAQKSEDFTINDINGEPADKVNEINFYQKEMVEINLDGVEEFETSYTVKIGGEEVTGGPPGEDEFTFSSTELFSYGEGERLEEGEYELEIVQRGPDEIDGSASTKVELFKEKESERVHPEEREEEREPEVDERVETPEEEVEEDRDREVPEEIHDRERPEEEADERDFEAEEEPEETPAEVDETEEEPEDDADEEEDGWFSRNIVDGLFGFLPFFG